jgi:hypothetical protein
MAEAESPTLLTPVRGRTHRQPALRRPAALIGEIVGYLGEASGDAEIAWLQDAKNRARTRGWVPAGSRRSSYSLRITVEAGTSPSPSTAQTNAASHTDAAEAKGTAAKTNATVAKRTAAPTDAAPTDAAPTDAAPTDAAPTDADSGRITVEIVISTTVVRSGVAITVVWTRERGTYCRPRRDS